MVQDKNGKSKHHTSHLTSSVSIPSLKVVKAIKEFFVKVTILRLNKTDYFLS